MNPGLVAVAVVLIFAGASFFFSLAETALFSLSKWQVRQMAERQEAAGRIVQSLLSEPQDLLATIVLGNTFASAAMLATGLWMALNGSICTGNFWAMDVSLWKELWKFVRSYLYPIGYL